MYVEEVCIDGFKSYAQRTVVPQFDQYFNAITGLNGSGKSNILDSICFVLGITNLSQVKTHIRLTLTALVVVLCALLVFLTFTRVHFDAAGAVLGFSSGRFLISFLFVPLSKV